MRLGQQNIERDALALRPFLPIASARFLTTPLTSTSWDGDGYSTTAKTLIDMSAVFGTPAGIKALLLFVSVRDVGAASGDCYLVLSPENSAAGGFIMNCLPIDRSNRGQLIVPCNADGDIYYQVNASGANTLLCYIRVWGYWG